MWTIMKIDRKRISFLKRKNLIPLDNKDPNVIHPFYERKEYGNKSTFSLKKERSISRLLDSG